MNILTLNCWSHSIRYHLYAESGALLLADGTVTRVTLGDSSLVHYVSGREPFTVETDLSDHDSAIACILATLTDPDYGVIADKEAILAVGHRAAHGGTAFRHSTLIDDAVLAAMRELHDLAPLHVAPNIAGIEAARRQLPAVPHVAVFDTAFHSSIPECAYLYPLPYEWHEEYRVRRYGFHGPSHLYLSRRAAVHLGKSADRCNLITIHIDRGVSLCAIRNGQSVDTSMGMTPLEGVSMETRCGDIDPGIPTFIMQQLNLSAHDMEQVLNHKSGIAGLVGRQLDRRKYLLAARDQDPRCSLALEIEAYRIRKYIGAYLAVIGPLDGIVFTSGTGTEERSVREKILSGMEPLGIWFDSAGNAAVGSRLEEREITAAGSPVRCFVIPTNLELVIAEDTAAILRGLYRDHHQHAYSFSRSDFIPYEPSVSFKP